MNEFLQSMKIFQKYLNPNESKSPFLCGKQVMYFYGCYGKKVDEKDRLLLQLFGWEFDAVNERFESKRWGRL